MCEVLVKVQRLEVHGCVGGLWAATFATGGGRRRRRRRRDNALVNEPPRPPRRARRALHCSSRLHNLVANRCPTLSLMQLRGRSKH